VSLCSDTRLKATAITALPAETRHHRFQQTNTGWFGSGHGTRPWAMQSRERKVKEKRLQETWEFSWTKSIVAPEVMQPILWPATDKSRATDCFRFYRLDWPVLCLSNRDSALADVDTGALPLGQFSNNLKTKSVAKTSLRPK